MVILLITTPFQLLSTDTTDLFKNIVYSSVIFENMKISFDNSYEKQQWTSTEFFLDPKA